jgi:hypothetical protein
MYVRVKDFTWCIFQLFFHPWLHSWTLMDRYKRNLCPLHKPRLNCGECYISWKLGHNLLLFSTPKFIFHMVIVCCMDGITKQRIILVGPSFLLKNCHRHNHRRISIYCFAKKNLNFCNCQLKDLRIYFNF